MEKISIKILAESDVFFAQNEALKVFEPIGFSLLELSKLKTIISELAYNIIKYAGNGTIKISKIQERGATGVLVEAIDKGDGINDLKKALSDNYSSGGTLGLGLPGIKRLADKMTIESNIDNGTHVKVTYWNAK